jgi:hypothetical protein
MAEVADGMRAVAAATGITDMFVDLMYVAKGTDEALALAAGLLAAQAAPR